VHWLLSLTLTDWQPPTFLDISLRRGHRCSGGPAHGCCLHTIGEPDFVSEGLVDFPAFCKNAFRKNDSQPLL